MCVYVSVSPHFHLVSFSRGFCPTQIKIAIIFSDTRKRENLTNVWVNIAKGLPWWFRGKESTCQCRRSAFDPWGWEDPLGKDMATHYRISAWEILRTENPGRLQCMGSQRVRHDLVTEQQTTIFLSLILQWRTVKCWTDGNTEDCTFVFSFTFNLNYIVATNASDSTHSTWQVTDHHCTSKARKPWILILVFH